MSASKTRTTPWRDKAASWRPLGLKLIPTVDGATIVFSSIPVNTFHTLITPSAPRVARRELSGEYMKSLMAVE